MQRGGGSKDTWVLAEGRCRSSGLLTTATQPIDVSRASFDLPSRVADTCIGSAAVPSGSSAASGWSAAA